jgi:hypothetical protein
VGRPEVGTGLLGQFKRSPAVGRLSRRLDHLIRPLWRREGRAVGRPFAGNGYNYEAAEVMRCLSSGCLESDVMPLDETIEILRTMDAIRSQLGIVYPSELRP